MLTDDSGMKWQIQGDTSTPREPVGHEVQITGIISTPSSDAGQASRETGVRVRNSIRAFCESTTGLLEWSSFQHLML
jgi:hypothetical protein